MPRPDRPRPGVHTAQAPGRLDVMGGIVDYSGGHVLQMALDARTQVRLEVLDLPFLEITTRGQTTSTGTHRQQHVRLPLRALPDLSGLALPDLLTDQPSPAQPVGLPQALREVGQTVGGLRGRPLWAAYVVGCVTGFFGLMGLPPTGLRIEISSDLPSGKGVSSSAALEVATLRALCIAYDITLPGTLRARLAQAVEHHAVGAPCGLMDQLASDHGRPGHLLPILCRPDILSPLLPLPAGVRFVGLDSGTRHFVGGSSYGGVRTGAFMGYALAFLAAGQLTVDELVAARHAGAPQRAADALADKAGWPALPFGGYLAAIPRDVWVGELAPYLPQGPVDGQTYLEATGGTPPHDPLSTPKAGVCYPVAAAAAHAVAEGSRVPAFGAALEALLALSPGDSLSRSALLAHMGGLMHESHHGYGACGLGSPATDMLEQLVAAEGPAAGLPGARITGGGSGGTVCVLVDETAGGLDALERVRQAFARHTGGPPPTILT